jgi:hypothetical protein
MGMRLVFYAEQSVVVEKFIGLLFDIGISRSRFIDISRPMPSA